MACTDESFTSLTITKWETMFTNLKSYDRSIRQLQLHRISLTNYFFIINFNIQYCPEKLLKHFTIIVTMSTTARIMSTVNQQILNSTAKDYFTDFLNQTLSADALIMSPTSGGDAVTMTTTHAVTMATAGNVTTAAAAGGDCYTSTHIPGVVTAASARALQVCACVRACVRVYVCVCITSLCCNVSICMFL